MTIAKHSLEKTGGVQVEGGTIHYRLYEPHDLEKAKNTPLIVVHGGPGASHALLYDYLGSLANDRPVLFYDQLGSYFSPAVLTKEQQTIERFTNELHSLTNTVGFERFIVLGHSWGGSIAANFASYHPDRLESLILSCPLLSTKSWVDDCDRLLTSFPKGIQETIRLCEAEGRTDSNEYKEAIVVFSAQHFCRLTNTPLSLQRHGKKTNREIYSTMWGPSELTCTGLLKNLDLTPRLREIQSSTLIVCGEYDTATPETMRDACSMIKGAELSVVPNCAHLPFLENNDLYLSAVRGFLSPPFPRLNNPQNASKG